MDARKIQFLIGMQREIDKLEAKDGNTPKVERVKSRFYDAVEVNELVEENRVEKKQVKTELEQIVNTRIESERSEIINEEIAEEPETKETLHRPKDVAAFLVRFRDRKNRGLKYLTHRWSDIKRDQPLTYDEVIANATKEFWECYKQDTIPVALKSKVGQYVSARSVTRIIDDKPNIVYPHFYYSTVIDGEVKRVDVYSGWSSDEMIEWVKNNPNSDPNQSDYWTEKLIQPFKRAIEVRDGLFELYMKMNAESILKADYQKFNPVYSKSLKEARFFTDVPTLFEGIRKLLAAAKDNAKEPSLQFDYHIPDSTDIYGIRQIKLVTDRNPDIGSFITKSQLINGGDLGVAYEHFYGLCNWSILCKRGDEYVRINLLTDTDGLPEIELIDEAEVEGFTHILTFYDL